MIQRQKYFLQIDLFMEPARAVKMTMLMEINVKYVELH